MEACAARAWPSPFDYGRQALLYLPTGMPEDPNDPSFTASVVEEALPILRASGASVTPEAGPLRVLVAESEATRAFTASAHCAGLARWSTSFHCFARSARIADGPDEVHTMLVAREFLHERLALLV